MTVQATFAHLNHRFSIEDPVFATHFEDAIEYLIQGCPVAHSPVGSGLTVFNRYRDVRRIGQDWKTFSSADGWMMDPPDGNLPILPEDCDPPYHTAWRQVLNPFFNAAAVAELEGAARRYAAELIDAFVDRGECDYIAEFAAKLPGLVLFRHILPVPLADLPALFRDIDTYSFGPIAERAPAFGRVHDYLEEFLRACEASAPADGLPAVLLAGVMRDGAPCSWADKVSTALDVVFGGLATTTHAMAGAMYEMARSRDVREAVMADAECLRTAVEETVRLYAPVVMVARSVRADTEVGGVRLQAGERVAINFAAASRDPEVCAAPREFDVRRNEVVHTAFGIGPHRCIGEHLARLEIRIAIEEFLRRIPDVAIAAGGEPVFESGQLRTMTRLRLAWSVRV
ncbi:MAG: cytochrome P450 [Pseudomonadales bacterium]|nr:cytochrome P450 [Pseudomonadales bacterium]MCP5185536.1 cytochrome P450 [Pseudomonadales bacterium]